MDNLFDFSPFAPAEGHVLCMKSLQNDLKAGYNGFQWPESGKCSAPDWKPTVACGNGLHAFLWGTGDSDLRCKDEDAKWLVMSVEASTIVDLEGKVKFPKCEVLYCGDRETAVAIIQHYAPGGTPVMFGTATAGYRGTATAGYRGTATAGDSGTATAGDSGTATAGYRGTATAGLYGYIAIEYYDEEKGGIYIKKMAFVDNVTILAGVKYRLNSSNEFEAINETEA